MEARKREVALYAVAELKSLESHFAEMAGKGWLIERITLFTLEYRAIEPRALHFIVDFLPKITAFDYPNNDDALEYRHICEQSGWTFAANSKQIQVFYAEPGNEVPIHTDPRIEAGIMLRACEKYELPFIAIGLFGLLLGLRGVMADGFGVLLSDVSLGRALALFVFAPPCFAYCAWVLSWYTRARIRRGRGQRLPEVKYRTVRIRGRILGFAALAALAAMLSGLALAVINGKLPPLMLIPVMLPYISVLAGLYIRKQIAAKKRDRSENQGMVALAIFGLVALYVVSLLVVIYSAGQYEPKEQTAPDGIVALTLGDVGIPSRPSSASYSSEKSFGVPLNFSYEEADRHSAGKGGIVITQVKKTFNSWLAKGLFDQSINDGFYKIWRERWQSREMPPEEARSWGAREGHYLFESVNSIIVLLLYEKAWIQIDCTFVEEALPLDAIKEKAAQIGNQ